MDLPITSNVTVGPVLANLFTLAITNLASSFYDELDKKHSNENLLFSPLSIFSALSMTMGGARNRTLQQMKSGLYLPNDRAMDSRFHQELGQYFRDMLSENQKNKEAIISNLANAIFVDESVPLRRRFVDVMTEAYKAKISNVDFRTNADEERKMINKWVSEMTKNKINELIPAESVDEMTRLVLVNAIYFKGSWKMPFDPKRTRKNEPFLNIYGKKEKVDMMSMSTRTYEVSYSPENEFDCSAIKLPFEDPRYQMIIALPNKENGFNHLQQKLRQPENLRKLLTTGFQSRRLDLQMPKFRLESSFKLNDILKALGMTDMFTNVADFGDMSEGESLKISEVLHKAFLEVNEKGSEASAATSVGATLMSLPPQFVVNRPFMLSIVFNETPLFVGRVVTLNNSN